MENTLNIQIQNIDSDEIYIEQFNEDSLTVACINIHNASVADIQAEVDRRNTKVGFVLSSTNGTMLVECKDAQQVKDLCDPLFNTVLNKTIDGESIVYDYAIVI